MTSQAIEAYCTVISGSFQFIPGPTTVQLTNFRKTDDIGSRFACILWGDTVPYNGRAIVKH